jgi:hypothetical protein
MTLQYENIFSIFLSKITDYSFIEYDESFIQGQMVSWLHSSSSSPRLRAKFSTFTLNDNEAILSFNLKNPVSEQSDCDFVVDVLARAMVIAWLEPEVKNVLLTKQLLTSSEEKFYAQANHISQLEQMLASAKSEFKNILRDYGYLNNSYIKE